MIELIRNKLAEYNPRNTLEEEHAIKEIIQEVALYALWRADFFEVAAFQGGTSLRVLHGLPRFSEDLDFILKAPDTEFEWEGYLQNLLVCFEEFGLASEAVPKPRINQRIQRATIKDSSIVNQLNLGFYQGRKNQKLIIKLEIDIDPPDGSGYEYSFQDFPLDYEVCHQDLPSNFALKLHALLCREYLKGRDWYDFSWYVRKGVSPNLLHLQNALYQYGPWQGDASLTVNLQWLKKALTEKIKSISWSEAANDVERFLNLAEQKSLQLWSERFFIDKLSRLG